MIGRIERHVQVKPTLTLLAMILLSVSSVRAAQEHSAQGLVVAVDSAHRQLTVSCDEIPGYMAPMEMRFKVHDAKELASLRPGARVSFTMIENGKELYADNIHAGTVANYEPEPMDANALTALHEALNPDAATKIVNVGEEVPDFALTDQAGNTVRLSQSRGKVVAITFGYSRCPNPNYCYRLSNNLAKVEKRFHARAGNDLVLMTIAIDPEYDKGEALARYADVWKADPNYWHFLTGSVSDIRKVAASYGMNFWRSEGSLTHTLHTVILDRDGRLAANLDGNQFTPQQLGDLVETVMNRRE
jgi:protein SCO1